MDMMHIMECSSQVPKDMLGRQEKQRPKRKSLNPLLFLSPFHLKNLQKPQQQRNLLNRQKQRHRMNPNRTMQTPWQQRLLPQQLEKVVELCCLNCSSGCKSL